MGGRRKCSIHTVLHNVQNVSCRVSGTVFRFFIMKISYKVTHVTKHGFYLMYSFHEYRM